jgi:hypothetical protein
LEPLCRVCGKSLTSLGTEEDPRWYCYKDDEVWLGEEQGWLERKQVEKPKTEQAQIVKYCKKCGNKLELEDEFCDKCGAEQKEIVVTVTAIKETSSKNRSQKTSSHLLIAVLLVVLLFLIAGAAWYNSIPKTAYFTIMVRSNTYWHGSYGSAGGMTTVDGSGNGDFQAHGTVVAAVFQIETANYGDTLTVSIYQGNTVLAKQTTTAAYGVVSVSATA